MLAAEISSHWQFPLSVRLRYAASPDGHEKRATAEMPRTGEPDIQAMEYDFRYA
jgi:hypothetical protein